MKIAKLTRPFAQPVKLRALLCSWTTPGMLNLLALWRLALVALVVLLAAMLCVLGALACRARVVWYHARHLDSTLLH